MTQYEQLLEDLAQAEMQLGEVTAEHRSECAAFGDSWPGACLDIDRLARVVKELEEAVARHPDHPKTVADMPVVWIEEEIPF